MFFLALYKTKLYINTFVQIYVGTCKRIYIENMEDYYLFRVAYDVISTKNWLNCAKLLQGIFHLACIFP